MVGRNLTMDNGAEQPAEPTGLAAGVVVGHYEVLRFLGDGGMAAVYLARDQTLGRRVALKLLRRNDEQAAVLEEARMLAQFNHPNIITVYGVGEHNGEAYIAMEYIEGETLRERADSEPLSLREIQRVALAVASGLEEAHRRNIVHGDLKPENIMIGRDGRARILDFGLAKAFEVPTIAAPQTHGPIAADLAQPPQSTQRLSYVESPVQIESKHDTQRTDNIKGTPAYMAPEQWLGALRTPAVDVWAFGVMFFELLTGERPFNLQDVYDIRAVMSPDQLPSVAPRRELPEALSELIDRSLAKQGTRRPSATELVRVFFSLVHGDTSQQNETESPFRGLSAFTEDHANFFFGRDEDIALFIERLRTEVVLPVIGASGVGKSSFIQAGVIPRLREKGEWRVVRMRPGSDPFRTLATRFHRTHSGSQNSSGHADAGTVDTYKAGEVADLAQQLYDNPKLLALWLQRQAKTEHGKVLFLVDQLEEICTLVSDSEVRNRFLAAVCHAADDPSDPVRVVFTARDDFLSRLAESDDARQALQRVAVLRAPGEEALREILLRPLQTVGYSYDDPELVNQVIGAVANESAALPLVQFMGSMLWERRDRLNHKLLRSAYETIGGVQGALATHADEVMTGLGEAQTRLVRAVMMRLVTPDGTRRVTSKQAIVEALGEAAEDILVRLSQARLLAVRDVFGETHYELSHESLVHTWDRLRAWLEEGRDEILFLNELEQASTLWDRRGRPSSEVWTGQALDDAIRHIDRYRSKLPELAALFVAASHAAERRRRLLKRIALVSATVALVTVAVVSVITSISFAEKTALAEQQRAQAQAEGARSALLRGDHIAARAQLRSSVEIADSPLVRTLWTQLTKQPTVWRKQLPSMLYDVAVSPDGKAIAVGALDKSVYLVDPDTAEARSLRDSSDQVTSVAFSPDGRHLVACDISGNLLLWDLPSRLPPQQRRAHEGQCWSVSYSPDGEFVVTASWDGTAALFASKDLAEKNRRRFGGTLNRSLISRDGLSWIVGDSLGRLQVQMLDGGAAEHHIQTGSSPITALSVDDSGRVVVGHENGEISLVSDTGKTPTVATIRAHESGVTDLLVDKSDGSIISVSYDGSATRWDWQGKKSSTWQLGSGGLTGLAQLPDLSVVTSGMGDRILTRLTVAPFAEKATEQGHRGPVQRVMIDAARHLALSGGDDGFLRGFTMAEGRQVFAAHLAGGPITALTIASKTGAIALGSTDKLIRVMADLNSPPIELAGHDNGISALWFTTKEDELISLSLDATLKVWSLGARKVTRTIALPAGAISGGFANGRVVVSTWANGTFLVDLGSGVVRTHKAVGLGAALSPDGSQFAVAGQDGVTRYYAWNGELKSEHRSGTGAGRFGSWRDGKLAFGFVDGARVFTPQTTQQQANERPQTAALDLLGHYGEVTDVALSPDGKTAVTAGDDGTVQAFSAESGEPLWQVRGVSLSHGRFWDRGGWHELDSSKPQMQEHPVASTRLFDEADGTRCTLSSENVLTQSTADTAGASLPLGADKVVRLWASTETCGWADSQRTVHIMKRDGSVLTFQNSELMRDEKRSLWVTRDTLVGEMTGRAAVAWLEVGKGATAVLSQDNQLIVGFSNGAVEFFSRPAISRLRALNLQEQPVGSIALMRSGPMKTLLLGFSDGTVGYWSVESGALLLNGKLHGIPMHVFGSGANITVMSALGSLHHFPLANLQLDRCRFAEEVIRQVPVVWGDGVAEVRSPVAGVGCD